MKKAGSFDIIGLLQAGCDSDKRIAVIGAGRIGSNVVLRLHSQSFSLTLIDNDIVSLQNIESGHLMPYGSDDIGKYKVDVLCEKMADKSGMLPKAAPCRLFVTAGIAPEELDAVLGDSVIVLWAIDSADGLAVLEGSILLMMQARIHIFAAMHAQTGGGHVAIWIPFTTPCIRHSIGLASFRQITESRAQDSSITNSDIRVVADSTADVISSLLQRRYGILSRSFDPRIGNYLHIEKLGTSERYRKYWIKPQGDPDCLLCGSL